jgi:hypothetical protein
MKNKYNLYYFLLALGFLLFASGSTIDKEAACSKYKNGTFIYYLKGTPKNIQFTIKREDSIQTETNLATGDYTKLQVKWISECVYELKFLESNLQYSDSVKKSLVLRNEILLAAEDYYVFKSQAKNHDFTLVDTAWVKK